jgi:Tfp pilus assembly protein PilN
MKRINLLPREQRAKASRERGLLYAMLLLVGIVVVLGLLYVQQNSVLNDRQQELDDLQAQSTALQVEIAALQPYQDLQTMRQQMIETATGIYQARVPWSNFLEELSLVIPTDIGLVTLNCIVPAAMQPGAAPEEAAAAGSDAVDITFTGQAWSHDDVAEFMTRLGLIPQIQNVLLTTSTGPAESTAVTSSTQTPGTFTVTAQLRPYTTPPPTTLLQEGE